MCVCVCVRSNNIVNLNFGKGWFANGGWWLYRNAYYCFFFPYYTLYMRIYTIQFFDSNIIAYRTQNQSKFIAVWKAIILSEERNTRIYLYIIYIYVRYRYIYIIWYLKQPNNDITAFRKKILQKRNLRWKRASISSQ